MQPFYGPNSDAFDPRWRDPDEEPLANLYELDRWDKHRALNLTQDVLSASLIGFDQLGIHVPPVPSTLAGWFEKGAVLGRTKVGTDHPQVDVYLRATFDVAFDRNGPAAGEQVIKTLDDIRQTIRGRVLPAFTKFFPTQ